MGINKAISSGASIGKAVKYVEKNSSIIEGIRCDYETALDEMRFIRQVWDKDSGRTFAHHCHSFAPDENITPEQAHELTKQIYEKWKPAEGFQIIIGTHADKGHIHSHIIINSVNPDTGKKYQQNAKDLRNLKAITNELCKEHGFGVPEKKNKPRTYNQKQHHTIRKDVQRKKHHKTGKIYKSHVLDCYKAVTAAKSVATSRYDFIQEMKKQGYKTTWTSEREHITFEDSNGMKVRAATLEKRFNEPLGKKEIHSKLIHNGVRELKDFFDSNIFIFSSGRRIIGKKVKAEMEAEKARHIEKAREDIKTAAVQQLEEELQLAFPDKEYTNDDINDMEQHFTQKPEPPKAVQDRKEVEALPEPLKAKIPHSRPSESPPTELQRSTMQKLVSEQKKSLAEKIAHAERRMQEREQRRKESRLAQIQAMGPGKQKETALKKEEYTITLTDGWGNKADVVAELVRNGDYVNMLIAPKYERFSGIQKGTPRAIFEHLKNEGKIPNNAKLGREEYHQRPIQEVRALKEQKQRKKGHDEPSR